MSDAGIALLQALRLEAYEQARSFGEANTRYHMAVEARLLDTLAREAKLRKALKRYGRHDYKCLWKLEHGGACSCGLDAALAPEE